MPGNDLRARLIRAMEPELEYRPIPLEAMADAALAVVEQWLRERAAQQLAGPVAQGRCRCGRATIVSERSGRAVGLGQAAEAIRDRTS